MSRTLAALFSCWTFLPGQWLSVGIKCGLPITATSDAVREEWRYGAQTHFQMKRYALGPIVEIGLPFALRLQAEALFRHARQDLFFGPAPNAMLDQEGRRMSIQEVPLLLKRFWSARRLRPFAVAGSTLRRIEDFNIDFIRIPTFPGFPATRTRFSVSSGEPIRYGLTAGGGLSWRLGPAFVEPEVRYTHWTARHWMTTTEQVDFLLGLRFPVWRRE